MKTEEIILVSDDKLRSILPYGEEDRILLNRYSTLIGVAFQGAFLEFGFWKVTIKSRFFGIYKELTLEKLAMKL